MVNNYEMSLNTDHCDNCEVHSHESPRDPIDCETCDPFDVSTEPPFKQGKNGRPEATILACGECFRMVLEANDISLSPEVDSADYYVLELDQKGGVLKILAARK